MISELVRHWVAEEMYVYPAMRAHLPDGRRGWEHDTREHKALEKTTKEREGVDPAVAPCSDDGVPKVPPIGGDGDGQGARSVGG